MFVTDILPARTAQGDSPVIAELVQCFHKISSNPEHLGFRLNEQCCLGIRKVIFLPLVSHTDHICLTIDHVGQPQQDISISRMLFVVLHELCILAIEIQIGIDELLKLGADVCFIAFPSSYWFWIGSGFRCELGIGLLDNGRRLILPVVCPIAATHYPKRQSKDNEHDRESIELLHRSSSLHRLCLTSIYHYGIYTVVKNAGVFRLRRMDEVFQQALGKRIKSLRLERTSLSQEKFAYQAGIDRTYYASIEQGKHAPTINLLRKIASSLGLTLSELLEGL